MLADIRKWLTFLSKVTITDVKDCIKFMTYYLHEMCVSTGYPIEAVGIEKVCLTNGHSIRMKIFLSIEITSFDLRVLKKILLHI